MPTLPASPSRRCATGCSELVELLTSRAAARGYLEIRIRRPGGAWLQWFVPVEGLPAVSWRSVTRAGDVYVGCLPRQRRAGCREAVGGGAVVWADCDDDTSVAALTQFELPPALVVASGTDGHRHAYWRLSRRLPAAAVERLNRRVAAALGADPAVAHPNAILRLPGTLNHKTDPPGRVEVIGATACTVDPASLDAICPQLPREARPARSPARLGSELRRVAPEDYVRVLLGVEVPAHRKVRCPGLHEDRTPSLHVYASPERGWFCFGCGQGGSIYDLAALAWGMSARGESFRELDRRLRRLFGCR